MNTPERITSSEVNTPATEKASPYDRQKELEYIAENRKRARDAATKSSPDKLLPPTPPTVKTYRDGNTMYYKDGEEVTTANDIGGPYYKKVKVGRKLDLKGGKSKRKSKRSLRKSRKVKKLIYKNR